MYSVKEVFQNETLLFSSPACLLSWQNSMELIIELMKSFGIETIFYRRYNKL